MKNRLLAIGCGMILLSSMALAAPEPAIVQGPGLWTTKVTYEPLRPVSFQKSPDAQPQLYWYTILTIENPTREDIQFYPKFDLVTDTVQVIPAGRQVPAALYSQLKQSHAAQYPLLQSLRTLMNQLATSENVIRQGSDHAVDILVVWPDFDAKAKQVSLYFTGMSNETAVVELPDVSGGMQNQVYLRKTLALTYDLRSQSNLRHDADAVFSHQNWVMR